ncbi:hypothetical protein MMC21_003430 [Puttea exsequens]|nr:hypothetical protein [Puttea exsequens]
MGKAKKVKVRPGGSHPYGKHTKSVSKFTNPSPKPAKAARSPTPTIPFSPNDRVLLVGEGDFSFSHSLLESHACTHLIATSYDEKSMVSAKYPQSAHHVRAIEDEEDCKVICGVDATRLGKVGASDGGGKAVKRGGFDKVAFNFPHVGGLTKDVNRQVRYNQGRRRSRGPSEEDVARTDACLELLVGFLNSAIPLLAAEGSIIVTIFEGEPYDLWNVKDLARHAGLKVEKSFAFQPSAYPGYKHARTLGNIEGGGKWKGEDRRARSYIFLPKERKESFSAKNQKNRDVSDSGDD